MEAPRKKSLSASSSSSSSSSAIANLPSYILMEVLCRLPVKTLVASKCVCKSWLHLIKDPIFTQLHQATAPFELCFSYELESQAKTLYMGNTKFNVLNSCHSLDVNVYIHTSFQLKKFKVYSHNVLNFNAENMVLDYSNCCNGLLCFGSYAHKFAVIWNPITGEFATFPSPSNRASWRMQCAYGLGFSRKANRFKLLRVVDREKRQSSERVVETEICTIQKGCSWKALDPFPYSGDSITWDVRDSTFLQGALHWVRVDKDCLEEREQQLLCSRSLAPFTNEFYIAITGNERNGHVCPDSALSIPRSSAAMSEPQQGTKGLTTGMGGESHGHSIKGIGLVGTSTPVVSAPKTSEVELAHQGGSKSPLTNDETHGLNNGMESSVPGTHFHQSRHSSKALKPLLEMTKSMLLSHEKEGRFCGMGLVQSRASCSRKHATVSDPFERIKTMMEEVLVELRKERQQRQELEERLRSEEVKVERLKEQIQQSEQLKQQDRQLMLQMMDEMRVRLTGSR